MGEFDFEGGFGMRGVGDPLSVSHDLRAVGGQRTHGFGVRRQSSGSGSATNWLDDLGHFTPFGPGFLIFKLKRLCLMISEIC